MPNIEEGYLSSLLENVTRHIMANEPEIAAFMHNSSTFIHNSDLLDPARSYELGRLEARISTIPLLADLEQRLRQDERLHNLTVKFKKYRGIPEVEELHTAWHISPIHIAKEIIRDYIYEYSNAPAIKSLEQRMEDNLLWCLNTGMTKIAFQAFLPYLDTPVAEIAGGFKIEPGPHTNQSIFTWGLAHPSPHFAIVTKDIEKPIIESINTGIDPGEVLSDIESLVIALRLLKKGYFIWEATRIIQAGPGYIAGPLGALLPRLPASPFIWTEDYLLNNSDLGLLRELLAYVLVARAPNCYDVSLTRLSDGITRLSAQDALLDYCISMENFFGGGEGAAASYKLGMRCARFMEESINERTPIKANVVNAWNIRSGLVHGGNDAAIEETATFLEDYLRKSHMKLARQYRDTGQIPTTKQFRKQLDDSLLGVE